MWEFLDYGISAGHPVYETQYSFFWETEWQRFVIIKEHTTEQSM